MGLFLSKEDRELLNEAKEEERKKYNENFEKNKQRQYNEKLSVYHLPEDYKDQKNKGEYEYMVKTIEDEGIHSIDYTLFQDMLNYYANLGWNVNNIHTKQLGINHASINGFGLNNTVNAPPLIGGAFFMLHWEYFSSSS